MIDLFFLHLTKEMCTISISNEKINPIYSVPTNHTLATTSVTTMTTCSVQSYNENFKKWHFYRPRQFTSLLSSNYQYSKRYGLKKHLNLPICTSSYFYAFNGVPIQMTRVGGLILLPQKSASIRYLNPKSENTFNVCCFKKNKEFKDKGFDQTIEPNYFNSTYVSKTPDTPADLLEPVLCSPNVFDTLIEKPLEKDLNMVTRVGPGNMIIRAPMGSRKPNLDLNYWSSIHCNPKFYTGLVTNTSTTMNKEVNINKTHFSLLNSPQLNLIKPCFGNLPLSKK